MHTSLATRLIVLPTLLFCWTAKAASVWTWQSTISPAVGETFWVTVSGGGFPETSGATLGLAWDTSRASLTNVVLATGSPFASVTLGPQSVTAPTTITLLAPAAAPAGAFNAFTMFFTALAAGGSNISLIDDLADFCWYDAGTSGCIAPMSYSQPCYLDVTPVPPPDIDVCAGLPQPPPPPAIPIPAAAWLLGSALWVLTWTRRRVS